MDKIFLTEEQLKHLSRDYIKNPLKPSEKDPLNEQDLKYLLLDLNLSQKQVSCFLGCSLTRVQNNCKKYKIRKNQKAIYATRVKTTLDKYGVENVSQALNVKEKIKQTNLERYGFECCSKNEDVKKKMEQTNMERYGVKAPSQNDEILQRQIKTNMDKYGAISYSQTLECKNKTKQLFMDKYGVSSSFQIPGIKEKIKKTNLERYGVENAVQNKNIQEKIKNTLIKKYGVEHPNDIPEIKQQLKNKTKQTIEKMKQTNLEKYGYENPLQNPQIMQKSYETKKKNKSLGTSEEENFIFKKLSKKFGLKDVKRQYKSKEYPFACDFYIISLDLYIEYQKFWTHGDEPYDPKNTEHQKILKDWQQRCEEKNFKQNKKTTYKTAITVWTIKDPLKRETVKKNNLNWIEFFSMDEFNNWYKNQ